MSVVSSGVQDTSTDIDTQLTGQRIVSTQFRTQTDLDYGLFGFVPFNTFRYDGYVATHAGSDVADLLSRYAERQATLQSQIDTELWGIAGRSSYDELGAIAAELQAQGEALPEGSLLVADAIQQIAAYNEYAADLIQ